MNTTVVTVDKEHPDEKVMEEAGRVLKEGGLVAFPTETVYGLGGDGLNPDSSRKIYQAKGRPSDNPLIIHIADMESLDKIVKAIPLKARKMAEAFWPGPLTMIFEKSSVVPYETTGGLESVAVRMPSHPVAAALIRAGGGYVAAPSANTSGRPSPTRASHVREDLEGKIDMIIDGGSVGIGLESTIVDFTEDEPVILRPGYINHEFTATYLLETHKKLSELILNPEEVSGVYEICIDDLINLFNRKVNKVYGSGLVLGDDGTFSLQSGAFGICDFTPHSAEYYLKILNTAKRYLENSKAA